ncbi:MAG: acetate--CoA ligase [Saprospiraceae bacterium]|nr:acetate--CoA ligase [Saprospiraceae bacterium]
MSYPFQIQSYDQYKEVYFKSINDPDQFWDEIAQHFSWHQKWNQVSETDMERADSKWFIGAKLNITENCLDRHLIDKADQIALLWEPNDPKEAIRKLSYSELHEQVCIAAQMLRNHGVKKGDRVCIYMGMIPELVIAMLACARIGAIHSIIFGGFSAQSIVDRVFDAQATFIITCDGAFRGGKDIQLKSIVDEALERIDSINKIFVVQRTNCKPHMEPGRDLWWHEEMDKTDRYSALSAKAESMDAEDMLFILYTSGSTGKPKGVVHTCGGYMVYASYSFVNVFQYKPGQIHFCTADIGWITGHSYIVYGPLCSGATTLMFEGIPTWPDAGRFWDIVDRHQVNILYTAPTAIRSLMTFGSEPLKGKSLASLKVLGSVGEPINEEAWEWYSKEIGKNNCPIADTWWQTETGGILLSNLAGVTPQKASYATLPLPGIIPVLLNEKGEEISSPHVNGYLCLKNSWPSMIRTTYGNHERCRLTYFDQYKGYYFTGDGAFKDENGFLRISGRVDDVLKISGHRIGTAEVENAINQHPNIIESAVVGIPHSIKGQGIYAFVVHEQEISGKTILQDEINELLSEQIGPIAKTEKIQLVSGLPKTRSGKIMRRILRKIAEGDIDQLGDTSTLLDPNIVEEIIKGRIH